VKVLFPRLFLLENLTCLLPVIISLTALCQW